MDIIAIGRENAKCAAPLCAEFRVELRALKGIVSAPNVQAGHDEILEYVDAGFPCFAAVLDGEYIGYIVCRVDEPTVWVESLFVDRRFRRLGVASALFERAEQIAERYGESTVFEYVHPNNDKMIAFARKHGYTVLNLIEIRKAYPGERTARRIRVGDHEFDY